MTLRERVIATAYTGTAFVKGDEIGAFYDYASEKLGYSVYSHEMASKAFWQLLKEKSKDDFVDMVSKKEGQECAERQQSDKIEP